MAFGAARNEARTSLICEGSGHALRRYTKVVELFCCFDDSPEASLADGGARTARWTGVLASGGAGLLAVPGLSSAGVNSGSDVFSNSQCSSSQNKVRKHILYAETRYCPRFVLHMFSNTFGSNRICKFRFIFRFALKCGHACIHGPIHCSHTDSYTLFNSRLHIVSIWPSIFGNKRVST